MVCDDGGRKRKTVVNIKSQKLILIYLPLIAKKVVCIRLVLALLEAVSCVAGLQWRGAWSDVKTVTGSQPGGGGHSLLHPLSLHHQTSPSYYGQHVSQLFLMISCCYCCQYLERSTSLLTVQTVHHHPTLCGRTRVR